MSSRASRSTRAAVRRGGGESMPRRAAAQRREVAPDPVYNNRLVTQLINKVLLDGKKSIAERIVYGAFDIVEQDAAAAIRCRRSRRRWTTSARRSRSSRSVSAAPRTRCRSRSTRAARPRSRSAGSSASRASAARRRWPSASPTRSWTPPTARRFGQEARGPVQDGRVEPCVLALPLVAEAETTNDEGCMR